MNSLDMLHEEFCKQTDPTNTIYPFFSEQPLSQRQRSILKRLAPFYTTENANVILKPLIEQEGTISLRALDWLVTNYAKKHNIVCCSKNSELFNIYHGYKVSLNHFRRRYFDPFRRRQRILIEVGGEHYETTTGQCNFLHWAHVNGVLQYAEEHSTEIELDMNRASNLHKAEKKKQKASGVVHKRKELSRAPVTKCLVYQVNTNVSFGSDLSDDSEA